MSSVSTLASSCVEPSLSYAIIERPLYEKAVCCIPLYLAAGDGAQLAGLHHADILAEMSLYPDPPAEAGGGSGVRVEVRVEAGPGEAEGWRLVFSSPHPGIAHLSVRVDGKHIRYVINISTCGLVQTSLICRNSPYAINVKALSLEDDDDEYVQMGDILNDNIHKSVKKCVTFDTQYFEM